MQSQHPTAAIGYTLFQLFHVRLENEDVRVAVGLRLGTALCKPHQCVCGAMVEANGLHGLSCKRGPVRHARHNAINDLIARALQRAEVPSMKEPAGLSRSDGRYRMG